MSDASQGPGWWQASDGKWYPPSQQPGFAPPPPMMAQKRRRGRGCITSIFAAIGVVVVIIVIVAIAASHSSSKLGSGTSSHPAAADVSVSSCSVDPTLGLPVAKGTVLNHSSGKSDYSFTVSFLNPSGTVVAQGAGIENDIEPHQSASFSIDGDSQTTGPVTCKIVDVTRFASS